MKFGKHWRRLRNARGLTLEELAELLGVARNTVASWEHDKNAPGVTMIPQLAKALGVAPGDLIAVDDTEIIAEPAPQEYDGCVTIPLFRAIPKGGWLHMDHTSSANEVIEVCFGNVPDDAVALEITTDEMYPQLRAGYVVAVDAGRVKPLPGDIIVALYRGEPHLAEYRIIDRQPFLYPQNHRFQPVPITDPEDLVVLGVVDQIIFGDCRRRRRAKR